MKLHPAHIFIPTHLAPSGKTLYRNNQDYMNNFFIDIVARSYTDIEKVIKEQDFYGKQKKLKQTMAELSGSRDLWKGQVLTLLQEQYDTMDKLAAHIASDFMPQGKQAVATIAFSKLL